MRWFKHMSTSQNDENLSELMDKFGAEGYGIWWIILERIAQPMDGSGRTFARFSLKVWATSAKVSVKKFQTLVRFLEKKKVFFLNYEDGYLTIDCPNLLKYRDEWTERQVSRIKKTPEQLPSNSRATPELDPDPDPEADTDLNTGVTFSETNVSSNITCPNSADAELQTNENKKINEISNCPQKEIIELYHKYIPGGTRVRVWSESSAQKLRKRWREQKNRQNLDWWEQFFQNISQLDFFMGRTEIDYQTNLDALISPAMFNKIISDHYLEIQKKKNARKGGFKTF